MIEREYQHATPDKMYGGCLENGFYEFVFYFLRYAATEKRFLMGST